MKRSEQFLDSMQDIREEWITDARSAGRMAPRWAKVASSAAIICLVAATLSVLLLPKRGNGGNALTEDTASVREHAEESRMESEWEIFPEDSPAEERAEATFFEIYHEVDEASLRGYLERYPETLENGWAHLRIEYPSGVEEQDSVYTVNGDQVLAIDAEEGVILIRIQPEGSRGVLAICKDTARISLCPAEMLGTAGQTVGEICEANSGILAMTGSAFLDDGESNGGLLSGLAVCGGEQIGSRIGGTSKRLELRSDNKMYVVDSTAEVAADTRDACEFQPALIIDGEITVDENCGWTSPQPRAVIGQTDRLETMMVVVEGRMLDSPGCGVVSIAEIMQSYGCMQALNLDGGTSAILYYDGKPITRCSNTALPEGRGLPSAWVYRRVE